MKNSVLAVLLGFSYAGAWALVGHATYPMAVERGWLKTPPAPVSTASPQPKGSPTALSSHFTSQPMEDSEANRALCEKQLEALGRAWVSQKGDLGQLADQTCPTTGRRYVVLGGISQSWIYCSGHGHGDQHFHWSSASSKVARDWADLPEETQEQSQVLRLRLDAAWADEDFALCEELCGQLEKLGILGPESVLVYKLEQGMVESAWAEEPKQTDAWKAQVLLEMGRYAEVESRSKTLMEQDPKGESPWIALAMAQMGQDKTDQVRDSLSHIQNDQVFLACAWLALKDYESALLTADSLLSSNDGRLRQYAGNAAVVGALARRLGGKDQVDIDSFLSRELQALPKAWPYPLLRYLNGDITQEELERVADDNFSHGLESRFTIGMDKLARGQDLEAARELLSEVASHGHYYEAMVARVFSK